MLHPHGGLDARGVDGRVNLVDGVLVDVHAGMLLSFRRGGRCCRWGEKPHGRGYGFGIPHYRFLLVMWGRFVSAVWRSGVWLVELWFERCLMTEVRPVADVSPRCMPALKVPEPEVSAEDPWGDDLLGRASLADKLTGIVDGQSESLVVSLHGGWGTGKTFFLKRWCRELENCGFRAIYFNAWEDDFCRDPMVAILGQMAEHLEDRSFKALLADVSRAAGDLLLENLVGFVGKHTGFSFKGMFKKRGSGPVDRYKREQRAKESLRESLGSLSSRVSEKIGHPLVFVVDELDRCRPTFAVELLERVKHVFDVPNLVFVFGLNRDELCVVLRSVYGDIDADVYLRKFFDVELQLTRVDEVKFVHGLMERCGLVEFLQGRRGEGAIDDYQRDFGYAAFGFAELWIRFGLSMRDLAHCVRLLALVARSLPEGFGAASWLAGVLIALKFKNPGMYRDFLQRVCWGSEVMDYLASIVVPGGPGRLSSALDMIERLLHLDNRGGRVNSVIRELEALAQGHDVGESHHLSKRVRGLNQDGVKKFLSELREEGFRRNKYDMSVNRLIQDDFVDEIGRLIDLHREDVEESYF